MGRNHGTLDDRARHSQGPHVTMLPVHHGLASEAALHEADPPTTNFRPTHC